MKDKKINITQGKNLLIGGGMTGKTVLLARLASKLKECNSSQRVCYYGRNISVEDFNYVLIDKNSDLVMTYSTFLKESMSERNNINNHVYHDDFVYFIDDFKFFSLSLEKFKTIKNITIVAQNLKQLGELANNLQEFDHIVIKGFNHNFVDKSLIDFLGVTNYQDFDKKIYYEYGYDYGHRYSDKVLVYKNGANNENKLEVVEIAELI